MELMKREAIRVEAALYPRYAESPAVAHQYAEAMAAGAQFPPITVDQHGRLIDGLHRLRAYDINGATSIPVERVRVKSDTAFFQLALEANASHGHRYTRIDYAHMILRGKALGMKPEDIAVLVNVTPGFLEEATNGWFAYDDKGQLLPLKRTIAHMSKRKLTSDQVLANKKLSGMYPTFYMNQVALLCDNDLLDTANEKVLGRLRAMHEVVSDYLKRADKRK